MRPTLSFYQPSPLPHLPPDTLIMSNTSTFEVALHTESFYKHCQGSQPGTQNIENGTGKRRLGRGTDLYSRSHRHRCCTSSKSQNWREPPFKTVERNGGGVKKNTQKGTKLLILASMGHRLHVHICASKCRNVKIKHRHTPSGLNVGGCVGTGHKGEIKPLPGTGSPLIKLALGFNQLCLQKWEHTGPIFPSLWRLANFKRFSYITCKWTNSITCSTLLLVMSASLSEFLYMFILFKARAVKKQNNKKTAHIFLK